MPVEGRSPGSGVPTKQHGIEAIGDEPSNARENPEAATEAMPEGQAGRPCARLEEEPGSESRMRETRTSGSMSGNRKRSHDEK